DIRYDYPFLSKYIIVPIKKIVKQHDSPMDYRLSELTYNEGYRGRWYKEWNENLSKSKIEKLSWSSYNNSKSFWLCKKDLTKAIHNVGFDSVFEQFNYTGDVLPDNYTHYHNRTMFVAIKN
ncbi:MAG TPA: methyltransferase type 11, partial [Chitinophagaceae bacterium]|nr:methyltransferase type 11 [Chitinophagaceae bacterium]